MQAVETDIKTNVSGASAWDWVLTKPFWFPSDHPRCAIWFNGETVEPVGPTGSREFVETYTLCYWEPAPFDDARLAPDDAATEALYVTYEAVRDRFMVGQNQTIGAAELTLPTAGNPAAGAQELPDGSTAFVRGFEIRYYSRRSRLFS